VRPKRAHLPTVWTESGEQLRRCVGCRSARHVQSRSHGTGPPRPTQALQPRLPDPAESAVGRAGRWCSPGAAKQGLAQSGMARFRRRKLAAANGAVAQGSRWPADGLRATSRRWLMVLTWRPGRAVAEPGCNPAVLLCPGCVRCTSVRCPQHVACHGQETTPTRRGRDTHPAPPSCSIAAISATAGRCRARRCVGPGGRPPTTLTVAVWDRMLVRRCPGTAPPMSVHAHTRWTLVSTWMVPLRIEPDHPAVAAEQAPKHISVPPHPRLPRPHHPLLTSFLLLFFLWC
jgi:hypothetical protein